MKGPWTGLAKKSIKTKQSLSCRCAVFGDGGGGVTAGMKFFETTNNMHKDLLWVRRQRSEK